YTAEYVCGLPYIHRLKSLKDYPVSSAESDAMSKDLKQRGFKFVGSTICYAHMQATGMVNDHAMSCFLRSEILQLFPSQRSRSLAAIVAPEQLRHGHRG